VLDARYEVFACKGKGVFSTVLRARDLPKTNNNNCVSFQAFDVQERIFLVSFLPFTQSLSASSLPAAHVHLPFPLISGWRGA
jgi:hypothetical protein